MPHSIRVRHDRLVGWVREHRQRLDPGVVEGQAELVGELDLEVDRDPLDRVDLEVVERPGARREGGSAQPPRGRVDDGGSSSAPFAQRSLKRRGGRGRYCL